MNQQFKRQSRLRPCFWNPLRSDFTGVPAGLRSPYLTSSWDEIQGRRKSTSPVQNTAWVDEPEDAHRPAGAEDITQRDGLEIQ